MTGLDTDKSHDGPSQDGTQRLYLTLSGTPPATWRDIFGREQRTPRSPIWREATVDGMCIVITCTPVSDCVEMYQNGQDENGAFFWHQICYGSRL